MILIVLFITRMAVSSGQVLYTALHFLYLLLIESSGISYGLYIGAVITAMIVFIIAVVVTCLVTWRHGSGRALVIVRKGRGFAFSDHQIAACAQATVRKPPTGRARSSSAQTAIKKRTKKEKENIQRSLALGYRKSKSLTNLAASLDADSINPFIEQTLRNKQSMSASCSALDLPLPPKPIRMSTLYEGEEQRKSAFLNVQNVAYTTNEELSSRPPCPPPYSEVPPQGPVYEQLDLV